jgi:hypothetical protein
MSLKRNKSFFKNSDRLNKLNTTEFPIKLIIVTFVGGDILNKLISITVIWLHF